MAWQLTKGRKIPPATNLSLPLFTFKGDEAPKRTLSDELGVYVWDHPNSSFDYGSISLQVDGVQRTGSLDRRVHYDRIFPVGSGLGHGEA